MLRFFPAQNNTDYKRMLRISGALVTEHGWSVASAGRCKSWSSVAMRKKLSAGMRKPSPLCACWLVTFFTIACQRFTMESDWRMEKSPPAPDNRLGDSAAAFQPHCSCAAQKPCRDLLADKRRRMPLSLKVISSFKSPALRNGRLSVMLALPA